MDVQRRIVLLEDGTLSPQHTRSQSMTDDGNIGQGG